MRADSDPALREPEAGRPLAPFGEVLRHFRRTAGFTQEQLAERTGLTREAISLLERGARQRPHPYTVQALCAALRLSPADSAIFVAAARSSPAEVTGGRWRMCLRRRPIGGTDVASAHPTASNTASMGNGPRSCPRTWCKSSALASRSPAGAGR